MNKVLVSVIVPIYNVEKFLTKCLRSLTEQTFRDIEIICINDGSVDNSLEIIKNFAKNDERVILINQANQGVSMARNNGLKNAKGNFILFVDGDDYVSPDFVEKLYLKAVETGADIVASNTVYVKNSKLIKDNFISKQTFKIKKRILSSIYDKAVFAKTVVIWGKLYSAEFIRKNNLKFRKGCRFEDNEFSFLTTILAEKIALEKNAELYYVIHPASLMANVFDTDTIFDFIKIFQAIFDEVKALVAEEKVASEYLDVFYAHITNAFYNVFKDASTRYKSEFRERASEILKNVDIHNKYFDSKTLRRYNKIMGIKTHFQWFVPLFK